MPRKLTAWFALLATILHGCANVSDCHHGLLIAEYRANEVAETKQAPYAANYALYRWDGPAYAASPHPQTASSDGANTCGLRATFHVARGEPVGFVKGETGELVAVAGKDRVVLSAGRFCWHLTPESEPTAGEKFLLALHDTGTVSAQIAAGICMAPLVLPLLVLFCARPAPGFGIAPGTAIWCR
jgi:hypothetical protein